MPDAHQFVLTLSCRDTHGIVHAVAALLHQAGCNILASQQFGDVTDDGTGLFFMRVHFEAPEHLADAATLERAFGDVRAQFGMDLRLHALARRSRLLLMVSRHGHCLNDLLYRSRTQTLGGALGVDIPAIVSNHADYADLAASYGVAFHHLPLAAGAGAEAKRTQERQIEALIERHRIDLVVLARYMQILSPTFLAAARTPIINIHHSFLPAFAGANPYRQAHKRGVKIIGATAHYVTEELDAGPIIEQDVRRVTHEDRVEDLVHAGEDVERLVLARAVALNLDDRVAVDGGTTVVF